MSQSEIERALAGSEFFKRLSADDIRMIAERCELKTVKAGGCLFRQGDFGEHMYIIAEGQVDLERSVDLGPRRGSVLVETLGKGRVLGCWSTMLGESHNLMSTACCKSETRVVSLKGDDIRAIMEGNTQLGFHIMERLSFLLRDRVQAAYGALEKI